MIITCQKCSTNFNLDNTRLPDKGTKVRCSVCSNIFMVFPKVVQQEASEHQEEPAFSMPDDGNDFDDSQFDDDQFEDEYSFDIEDQPDDDPSEFDMDDDEYMLSDDDFFIDDGTSFDTDDDFLVENDNFESPVQDDEFDIPVTDETDDFSRDLEIDESGIEIHDDDADEAIQPFGLGEEDLDIDSYEPETEDAPLLTLDESDENELEVELSFDDDKPEMELEIAEEEPEVELSIMENETEPEFTFEEDSPEMEISVLDEDPEMEFATDDNDSEMELTPIDDDSGMELSIDDGSDYFSASDETGTPELQTSEPSLSLDTDGQQYDNAEFQLEVDTQTQQSQQRKKENDDAFVDAIHPLDPQTPQGFDTKNPPPSLLPVEDDFSEFDNVLDQETEPEDIAFEEDDINPGHVEITKKHRPSLAEEIDPLLSSRSQPPKAKRQKKSSHLIGTPVLILFLLFLLVSSAYVASLVTGYKIPYLSEVKIPFVEQQLKKFMPQMAEAKPVTNQKSVNGRFVTNKNSGTLFVITGKVENPSDTPLNNIEIRGALIINEKVEAVTKTAFCGNILTEDMLKTGLLEDMRNTLNNPNGNHDSNINVQPGTSIPFMVVFSDLPEKLENFAVKIHSFKKAGPDQQN